MPTYTEGVLEVYSLTSLTKMKIAALLQTLAVMINLCFEDAHLMARIFVEFTTARNPEVKVEFNQLHLHQLSCADNNYPPGGLKRQKECLPGRIRTIESLTALGLHRPLIRCLEPLDHQKCSMCSAFHPGPWRPNTLNSDTCGERRLYPCSACSASFASVLC